jgi:hypothetical protein
MYPGSGEIASRSRFAYPDKVYIKLDSRKTRGETMKKSESDSESELRKTKNWVESLQNEVNRLIEWNVRLQEEIRTLQTGDNTGFKHQNDGGWFD